MREYIKKTINNDIEAAQKEVEIASIQLETEFMRFEYASKGILVANTTKIPELKTLCWQDLNIARRRLIGAISNYEQKLTMLDTIERDVEIKRHVWNL